MSSPLECHEHGPITYYRTYRKLPGKPIRVGIYVVDGVMIDTGPRHCRDVVDAILEREQIDQIVLTHHHEDHTGNAAYVAARTGAVPWIHPVGQPLAAAPARLPLYRRVYWGQQEPVETQALADEFITPSYRFRVIHTPGHAPDHVILHEAEQNWLFGGDLYLTDRVNRAFEYEDMSLLIDSIRSVLAIADCEFFCQHSGRHPSHQHRIGRKLDRLLGLRNQAVVHLEEGLSIREITRAIGIGDGFNKLMSGGQWSSEHLVHGLLRDAGRLD